MNANPPDASRSSASFWNRDFLLGLASYFFLFMAVSNFFLLPLFLQQLGAKPSRVGLIMGIHSVVAIAVRPFFGRRIDARGGRRLSLAGILMLVAAVPLFHLVRDAGAVPFLLRALTGLGWGLAMTATVSVCTDFAPVGSLARSMGLIGVAGLLANALGPLIAEEVIARYGFGGLFNASLLMLVVSFLCVAATRTPARPDGACEVRGRLSRGGAAVLTFVIIAGMPVFHGAVRGAMLTFVALFAAEAGLGRIGPFFLVFSVAAIMTRFGVADLSDRHGRKRVIFPAAVLIGLNLFLLASVRSQPLFLVSAFLGGLGQGFIFPALSTYIIDFMGHDNKAFAISLYQSLFDVGMGVGAPLFGWVSDGLGYRGMYMVAGSLLLAATAVFMVRAPVTENRAPGGRPA